MKTCSRRALSFLSLLSTIALTSGAQANPSLATLKGPSGIALVELFEHPPVMSNGKNLSIIAVPSADIMAAKVISGEYTAAVLPLNMAAKLRASGIQIGRAHV